MFRAPWREKARNKRERSSFLATTLVAALGATTIGALSYIFAFSADSWIGRLVAAIGEIAAIALGVLALFLAIAKSARERSGSLATTLAVVFGAVTLGVLSYIVLFNVDSSIGKLVIAVGEIEAVILGVIAVCGVIVLRRDVMNRRSKQDLFLDLNRSRSDATMAIEKGGAVGALPRVGRLMGVCGGIVVGDVAEIRSFEEIARTLDENASLEGLPFMPEMRQFCGQKALVFRCVDKIWDYNRSHTLRRLDNAVLLAGLRCSGSAHDDCQAGCYLIWKLAWLKRVPESAAIWRGQLGAVGAPVDPESDRASEMGSRSASVESAQLEEKTYRCQYTELYAATKGMSPSDRRQDFLPVLSGNVTLSAFLVAIATRVFNRVQRILGAVEYLTVPPGQLKSTPTATYSLQPGDIVRVRPKEAILATLNADRRNRGLWFDREMLKRCGQRYRVARRVERLIDDKSGKMLEMKTPCIVLEGVYTSGEFERFCPQHDEIFWRELWLEPEEVASQGGGGVVPEHVGSSSTS